jgi:hypothetical protein
VAGVVTWSGYPGLLHRSVSQQAVVVATPLTEVMPGVHDWTHIKTDTVVPNSVKLRVCRQVNHTDYSKRRPNRWISSDVIP